MSFGSDPERYDRTRPGYPDAIVQAIVSACPGTDVLDVGCGTGIVARRFQAAGCNVLGVDPDARMAAFARRHGLEVEVTRFEDWDPAGRTFDAVVAGQTWHWIDPVAGAHKAAETLRAGGRLAAFWNVLRPSGEIASAFSGVYQRVTPGFDPWSASALDAYSAFFAKADEGIRAVRAFGEPERWRFEWERLYTRDQWLDRLPTGGDASRFSPATLGELLARIGAAIDALGGSLRMRFATVAVTAPLSPRPRERTRRTRAPRGRP